MLVFNVYFPMLAIDERKKYKDMACALEGLTILHFYVISAVAWSNMSGLRSSLVSRTRQYMLPSLKGYVTPTSTADKGRVMGEKINTFTEAPYTDVSVCGKDQCF